jgi:type I restriction enzyme S subunit
MGDQEPFPKITLGTLGKWVTGSTPKTSNPLYQGEDVPFVTPGDILYGGEIINVKRRISNLGADAVRRLPPPSVQVVCIGATLGKVGYSSEEVTTNQQITSLLPDEDVVTAGYAAWLLSSPLVQSLLWKYSSSTTVPILNKGTLEQIEVPLAPLEKQAEILAQIDDQTQLSVSLSERTILVRGNIDSLRRSILHRAFSGELLEGKV